MLAERLEHGDAAEPSSVMRDRGTDLEAAQRDDGGQRGERAVVVRARPVPTNRALSSSASVRSCYGPHVIVIEGAEYFASP